MWERRTIATNSFLLLFGESEGKSLHDRNCLKSMTNHAAGIGTCTQSGMTIPSYRSSEMHLGKFPDHTEISELDCEFPSRSLREGKESHARFAVDRGNRSSHIAWWSHHSEINHGQRFPWLWRIGYDDGGSIEKGATISKHTSERRSVSKSRELKRTTDFSEEDKLLIWSTNISDLLDPMMKYKDYRDCSKLNWRLTTFRILSYVRSNHCHWQVVLHRIYVLEGLYVSKLQDSS